MKSTHPLVIGIIIVSLMSSFCASLFAQNQDADKKIAEIEGFKKYNISKFDLTNSKHLASWSDSVTEIFEWVNYRRKNTSAASGKVTERSRSGECEKFRTYYFNENGKLFAIAEELENCSNKKFKYYFGGGQFVNVIDENKNDVTATIDKAYLYYWIRRVFDDQIIQK